MWGWATTTQGRFPHAWLLVDGVDFDPVLWVRRSRATYEVDPRTEATFERGTERQHQRFLRSWRSLIRTHYGQCDE